MCNRIEMVYIFMEVCGLTADESEILLSVCDQPSKSYFSYRSIINRLKEIEVGDVEDKRMIF